MAARAQPSGAAAELCRRFSPDAADALARFVSAPVTVVHLGFSAAEVPRGFGLLDLGGTLHTSGVLFPSSIMPDRAPSGTALVTCITGGARHPEHARLPDADLAAAVLADLRATVGIGNEPVYQRLTRHSAAISLLQSLTCR